MIFVVALSINRLTSDNFVSWLSVTARRAGRKPGYGCAVQDGHAVSGPSLVVYSSGGEANITPDCVYTPLRPAPVGAGQKLRVTATV